MKKAGINSQYPHQASPINGILNALNINDKIATKRKTSPTPKVPIAASYFPLT